MDDPTPTDAERYPTLSEHGRSMLAMLREHPYAPIYRNQSGNRLTADEVERVRAFEREVADADIDWAPGVSPPWIGEYIAQCYAEVPHYRRLGIAPARLADVPPIGRKDLAHDVAAFVPDSAPLKRLINFRTSGTTGHPLLIASHPVVAASYLAFHKRALRRCGVELRNGSGQVGVVLLGYQRECFTYVSVTPTMDDSGLAKINLHPHDWRDPDDRARYLDALEPEVYAGDPISCAVLLELPMRWRPRALLSTSMALTTGLRERLESRFACPVLDLYSLNEAGPVAVADAHSGGHVLLQHRMYVEILDETGQAVPAGTRGEIALTGGFNFCLPLLRYRTGDFASLDLRAGELVLIDLAGRPPVRFRTAAGEWINNIEITHRLRRFALPQFTVHQDAAGSLRVEHAGGSIVDEKIRDELRDLFGTGTPICVAAVDAGGAKHVQYTSDLPGACA